MNTRGVLVGLFLLGLLTSGVVATTNVVDVDGDATPIVAELDQGTDPFSADTDGDGLDDGEEVDEYGTDPLVADTDGDGLADGVEVTTHGTDPLVADTDRDGLTDGAEVDEYGTAPTDSDSDDDGLRDGAEVTTHGTDPLAADTDGDGLDDGEEVDEYGTDPLAVDTDDDGLTDEAEIDEYGTDPTVADTDDDGLEDGAEVEHGTDPQRRDTDGDGLWDGMEVHASDRLPDADPLRYDVYVEVDEMSGQSLGWLEAGRVTNEFADAPIENPDGSTGVDLHFVRSDDSIPHASSTSFEDDLPSIKSTYFDNEGYGYHYLLIADSIDSDQGGYGTVVLGLARSGTMLVADDSRSDATGSTVMHELGHSLGLTNRDFGGVDSETYSFAEYPSVMNYNAPLDHYGFSDGSNGPLDHDDWATIERDWYTPGTYLLE
ncbi:hypothetical protein Halru_2755 [Halovivax ruber XH-70]|uniref:Thrombospondin type 3 repeat-containing protein n=1 Tax=Halovivax ruber (strain DSM 18193 / JCM 13892 / XH-70) TaxID=797302 RepID=L0ICR7_HALRX|nr:hypothetical protein [Halovivax ruber]AGB17330.1 hypothetical protein Halru_2755 [Halovivax ruber XH-70]